MRLHHAEDHVVPAVRNRRARRVGAEREVVGDVRGDDGRARLLGGPRRALAAAVGLGTIEPLDEYVHDDERVPLLGDLLVDGPVVDDRYLGSKLRRALVTEHDDVPNDVDADERHEEEQVGGDDDGEEDLEPAPVPSVMLADTDHRVRVAPPVRSISPPGRRGVKPRVPAGPR